MSTRANIIIKDEYCTLYFYRHSDGYPSCTFEDLKGFVKDYTTNHFRLDAGQSAGHLILRGHAEYKTDGLLDNDSMSWKVGSYEPTDQIHGDVEYVYTINLIKRTLSYGKTVHKF